EPAQVLAGILREWNESAGRKNVPGHDVGEGEDKEQPEVEVREGDGGQCHASRQEIDESVPIERRYRADDESDRDGNGHGREAELERDGKALDNRLQDGLLGLKGPPKVAAYRVRKPGDVLHRHRLV